MCLKETGWVDWNVFVRLMIKSEWRVLLYIVLCNKVHRQLCLYSDAMNIVFTFLYTLFYNDNHPLSFLKDKEFLD